MPQASSMLRALRVHPHLRRLWLASTVSLLGDWLSFVAVSLLAVDHGGGALSLAIVLAVHSMPRALLAPVAGALADRLDRKSLLIGAAIAQAALTVLMALAALRGAVVPVQILVLVRSAVGAFVVPAETAALRRVVPEDELLRANTLLSSTWSVTYVAGMALGGAIAALGPATAMILDAASFAAAALLLRGLPGMRPLGEEAARAPRLLSMLAATPRDLREALRIARRDEALFQAVFAKAPIALAGGAAWVVLNLVAGRFSPLGSAALSIGILQAVRGAGTGIGPLAADALVRRGREWLATHLSALLVFISVAIFPLTTSAPVLIAVALVWGMGSGSNWVLSSAAMQRRSPDAILGRLASVDDLTMTIGQIVGALLGAALAERTDTMDSMLVATCAGGLFGLAAWALLMRPRASSSSVTMEPQAAPNPGVSENTP